MMFKCVYNTWYYILSLYDVHSRSWRSSAVVRPERTTSALHRGRYLCTAAIWLPRRRKKLLPGSGLYILLYTSYFHNVNNCKHCTRALVDIGNKKTDPYSNDSTCNIVSSLTPEGREKWHVFRKKKKLITITTTKNEIIIVRLL